MPKQTIVFADGSTKVIDLSAWGGLEGFLVVSSDGNASEMNRIRTLAPWLQRAIAMTANAVSTIPFDVIDASGETVDTSSDWQNLRGGIANPARLIYLVAASLCSGAAYVRISGTRAALADVRYQTPQSITPNFNQVTGELVNFRRQVNGRAEIIPIDEMAYFWLPDDSVEIGPAQISPVKSAALSAHLLGQMDTTLATYGQNGFVPPMILSAKGMPNKTEAEKAERWWNLFLRGKAGVAKIFNAESITPQAVGAGMAEMRGSYIQITRQQIENIGAAFGIPAGVFMSNAANFATALADRRNWYESGVFVLLYQTIQETLTDQVFSRFGLRFQFNVNGLDAFQDDEVQKASSFGAYVSAGLPKSLAAELVGLDMPSGWDYSMLDAAPAQVETPQPAPPVIKHLPGEHDQSSHAGAGGGTDIIPGGALGNRSAGLGSIAGKLKDGSTVIKVDKFDNFEDLSSGIMVVSVKGDNKGKVYYSRGAQAHSQAVEAFGDNIDNYVRFTWSKSDKQLHADQIYAASLDPEEGLDNIYYALDKLSSRGVPDRTRVLITTDRDGKNGINTTVKILSRNSNAQGDAMAKEILTWRRYSKSRAGKQNIGDFEYQHIPLALAAQIQARLKDGYSDDIFTDALKELPTILLADAINGQ